MKKLAGIIARAFTYFCIATVIAQLVGIGMLAFRGVLTAERRAQIVAVILGIDLTKAVPAPPNSSTATPHSPATVADRVAGSSDLTFRRDALKRGLDNLGGFQSGLKIDRQHFEKLRQEFGVLLSQLEAQLQTQALQSVQHMLEALKPKDAKDQLLRMMDDGATDHVVRIVKSMPLDKRRKILMEFKSPDEARRLHELLILLGTTKETELATDGGQPK